MTKSRIPSPFTSPAAMESGKLRAKLFTAEANPPLPLPAKKETLLAVEFPVTMSRLPSRLKSPITNDVGFRVGGIHFRRLEAGLRRWRLVRHHAVVEEDFHLAGVVASDSDVILAGMASIPNGDAIGIGAGRQSLTTNKPAAALAVEDGNSVIAIVCDGEIGNSVAVQIADRYLVGQGSDIDRFARTRRCRFRCRYSSVRLWCLVLR